MKLVNKSFILFLLTFVVSIIYNVYSEEVSKQIITKIDIRGIKSFPETKLRKLLNINVGEQYEHKKAESAIAKIIDLYKSCGFAKVEVDFEIVYEDLAKEKVNLIFLIDEGKKFYIRNISCEGNKEFSSKKLIAVSKLKSGQLFIPRKLEMGCANISIYYFKKFGIEPLVDSSVNYDDENGLVDIIIKINEFRELGLLEGYKINNVYTIGLENTYKYVVLREFYRVCPQYEGLTAKKLAKALKRIENELAWIKVKDVSGINVDTYEKSMDLILQLEEGKPGWFSVGIGYQPWYNFLGTIEISHSNLFRRGYKVEYYIEYGQRRADTYLSFTAPWVFNKPLNFCSSIGYNKKNYCYAPPGLIDEFTVMGPYIKFNFGYPIINDYLTFSVDYSISGKKIVSADSEYIKLREKTDIISGIGIRLHYFYLFEPFYTTGFPPKSIKISIGDTLTGGIFGGSVDTHELYTNLTFCLPFLFDNTLSFHLNMGTIKNYGKTSEVPIYMKYFPGGFCGTSGYDFWGQIGPPEGGNINVISSIRYHIPLIKVKPIGLVSFVSFFEIGNSWKNFSDIRWATGIDDNSFKRSVGFGIGIFPGIGLQYSKGLDAKPGERNEYFYFVMSFL